MADHTPQLELCAGTYRASQIPGTVLLYAHGIHPTAGYHTFWFQESSDLSAPRYSLWHVRPGALPLQVVTPFSAATSFQTMGEVTTVTVRDSKGLHTIAVERAPELAIAHRSYEKAHAAGRQG